ncbi:hypothetical protein DPEC_G00140200 [Dallia pectoralis]|uniref:Uncharacterized protein n=1 Tax=Dallia pectoralis TaxID=75939 RepID=A0ACC2GM40_DALPE|nr:hypothetical protein DPEC_G00140200 [Dallia pectoralis]
MSNDAKECDGCMAEQKTTQSKSVQLEKHLQDTGEALPICLCVITEKEPRVTIKVTAEWSRSVLSRTTASLCSLPWGRLSRLGVTKVTQDMVRGLSNVSR